MLGSGIIKGFIETGRNFAESYFVPERLTTVQYPEEQLPPHENTRTIPFLVYDASDPAVGLRCTACQICEQECPPGCIRIVKDTTKKPDFVGKMQFQPAVFEIDISVCMGCGICAEVCPFDSIKMDHVFNLCAVERLESMLVRKERLAKSNDYFRSIHPREAREIDAQRGEEKAKAEAKTRAAAAAKASPATNPVCGAAA